MLSALLFPCLHYTRGQFDPAQLSSKPKSVPTTTCDVVALTLAPLSKSISTSWLCPAEAAIIKGVQPSSSAVSTAALPTLKEIATSPKALVKFLWVMKNHNYFHPPDQITSPPAQRVPCRRNRYHNSLEQSLRQPGHCPMESLSTTVIL